MRNNHFFKTQILLAALAAAVIAPFCAFAQQKPAARTAASIKDSDIYVPNDVLEPSFSKKDASDMLKEYIAAFGDSDIGAFIESSIGPDSKGNSEIERWRKALSENLGIRPMSEYDGSPIYKVVVMCTKEEQLAEARELLEADFSFVVQEVKAHSCINGELVNRAFDKGKGVRLVYEHFGLTAADTYGFGDSMNDLEMMQTVGTSVCMENGAEALKEIADLVCPSVDDDGLYKAFEKLQLL